MKHDEQYGYVVHSRWSDDEEPKATVIRSYDGWLWHDICVTSPDSAVEISEALGCMAELRALREGADEIERLQTLCNDLYHDATCTESWCRLCGDGLREWEARREQ